MVKFRGRERGCLNVGHETMYYVLYSYVCPYRFAGHRTMLRPREFLPRSSVVRKPRFCPSGRPGVARAPTPWRTDRLLQRGPSTETWVLPLRTPRGCPGAPPGGHIGAYRRVLVRKPRFCLSGRPGAARAHPGDPGASPGRSKKSHPDLKIHPKITYQKRQILCIFLCFWFSPVDCKNPPGAPAAPFN